jgi:hypothetical protein
MAIADERVSIECHGVVMASRHSASLQRSLTGTQDVRVLGWQDAILCVNDDSSALPRAHARRAYRQERWAARRESGLPVAIDQSEARSGLTSRVRDEEKVVERIGVSMALGLGVKAPLNYTVSREQEGPSFSQLVSASH